MLNYQRVRHRNFGVSTFETFPYGPTPSRSNAGIVHGVWVQNAQANPGVEELNHCVQDKDEGIKSILARHQDESSSQ